MRFKCELLPRTTLRNGKRAKYEWIQSQEKVKARGEVQRESGLGLLLIECKGSDDAAVVSCGRADILEESLSNAVSMEECSARCGGVVVWWNCCWC